MEAVREQVYWRYYIVFVIILSFSVYEAYLVKKWSMEFNMQ